MFLGSARFLKLGTAFVDSCDRVEFVNGRIDAQVLSRSKSEVFEIFKVCCILCILVKNDCWWKPYSSKLSDEL